jgi:hypothetical protein
MLEVILSSIYKFPELSTATAAGDMNADVAGPLGRPPPATVVMMF